MQLAKLRVSFEVEHLENSVIEVTVGTCSTTGLFGML